MLKRGSKSQWENGRARASPDENSRSGEKKQRKRQTHNGKKDKHALPTMKHIIIMLVHLIGIAIGIVLHHIFIVVEGIVNRPISSWNMPTLSLDYIFVRWMTAFRPFVIVLAGFIAFLNILS